MKKLPALLMAGCLFVAISCSKKDKTDDNPPPATEGYIVKIDGKTFVGEKARTKTDTGNALIKIGKNIKIIANSGADKGIFVAIELINDKLVPGTYSLKPGSNGSYAAQLFYSEDLDKPTSVNYASYYVKNEDQDGQVIINTANDHQISGTFRGKVLTAFGQVSNPTKVLTDGKINIKF